MIGDAEAGRVNAASVRPRRVIVVVLAAAVAVVQALPALADPIVDERELLGESFEGRPIRAFHRGDPDEVRVLIVGTIHGDEPAGLRIVRRLRAGSPRRFLDLWIVPTLNPDGLVAGTRQNSRGVDLNRNFPFRWRPGPRGRYYPGRRPASEPETRIAIRLARRIRPDITIWFHQPLALVDPSTADGRIERRYAWLVGLPVHRLPRYHGTATSWQNRRIPGSTAFVVELPGGPLRPRDARRYANAVHRLVRPAPSSPSRSDGSIAVRARHLTT